MKIIKVLGFCLFAFSVPVFSSGQEQVVVITGASSGIGKALAEKFAKESGHKVYGTTRNHKLTGLTPEGYILIQMDPGNTQSVGTAIEQVSRTEKSIDLLINNAGFMVLGSVESIDPDDQLLDMFNVNVVGYARTTRAVVPFMRSGGGGRIINITSTQAFEPRALQESYSATRSAVEIMSLGQASYLKEYNIDVLVYEPGATRTNIMKSTQSGRHDIPGDKTQSYMPQFIDILDKRLARGMLASEVSEDIFDLSKNKMADFRTQASIKGVRRAEFVYKDATGNSLLALLKKQFDQFVAPFR